MGKEKKSNKSVKRSHAKHIASFRNAAKEGNAKELQSLGKSVNPHTHTHAYAYKNILKEHTAFSSSYLNVL
jgi:hypothetical protein